MRILKLYTEDFPNETDWVEVCDALNISYDTKKIIIECNNVYTDDDLPIKEA